MHNSFNILLAVVDNTCLNYSVHSLRSTSTMTTCYWDRSPSRRLRLLHIPIGSIQYPLWSRTTKTSRRSCGNNSQVRQQHTKNVSICYTYPILPHHFYHVHQPW